MRKWTLLPLLSLLLISSGCATVMPPERYFEATALDFTKRLRWKDYHGAARHFDPGHVDPFLHTFTPLDDLHITDIVLDSADPQPDGRIVTVSTMEYYILPSTTIRHYRFRQEWVYHPERAGLPGVWRIATPFPDFPPPRRP